MMHGVMVRVMSESNIVELLASMGIWCNYGLLPNKGLKLSIEDADLMFY